MQAVFIAQVRDFSFPRAAVKRGKHFPALNNIAPIVAAGIMDKKHDLGKSRNRVQDLKNLRGQRGNAKDKHPARKGLRTFFVFFDFLQELLVQKRAAGLISNVFFQQPPKSRLPELGSRNAVFGVSVDRKSVV